MATWGDLLKEAKEAVESGKVQPAAVFDFLRSKYLANLA